MYTIPNVAQAGVPSQADWDKVDIDIVTGGMARTGVLSGCAVTAQVAPNMTVAVAAGVAMVNNAASFAVTGGNLTIATADGTNPRYDLVVSNSSGTKSVVTGSPAAAPVFPSIPANSVVFASVYVPAGATSITSGRIIDKRVQIVGSSPQLSGTGVQGNNTYWASASSLGADTSWFDVRAFGAVGDGVTNDQAAVNLAAAAALAAPKGATLYFPPGHFVLVDGLPLAVGSGHPTYSGSLSIVGAGIGATTISAGSTSGSQNAVFLIKGGKAVHIHSMSIVPATGGAGVRITNSADNSAAGEDNDGTQIHNVWFDNGGAYGVKVDRGNNWKVSMCNFIGKSVAGVYAKHTRNVDGGGGWVVDCDFNACTTAGIWAQSSGWVIHGNVFNTCAYGIYVKAAYTVIAANITQFDINGNQGVAGSSSNFLFIDGTDSTNICNVGGVYINGNHIDADAVGIRMVHNNSAGIQSVTITGNGIRSLAGSGGACIEFSKIVNSTIVGNHFNGSSANVYVSGSNSTGVLVAHNTGINPIANYPFDTGGTFRLINDGEVPMTVAFLGSYDSGSRVFLTNAQNASDNGYAAGAPVAGGTGAVAVRRNNAWRVND